LFVCWCARKHGCNTFRIDVEGQEYQRLVARVSPLVHEGVWFIDQGTWSPCFCLTADRDGSGAVAELVGIEGGVVSGVINLESSGVEALDWRPRHDERYHEA
jgi:hypothetical protein